MVGKCGFESVAPVSRSPCSSRRRMGCGGYPGCWPERADWPPWFDGEWNSPARVVRCRPGSGSSQRPPVRRRARRCGPPSDLRRTTGQHVLDGKEPDSSSVDRRAHSHSAGGSFLTRPRQTPPANRASPHEQRANPFLSRNQCPDGECSALVGLARFCDPGRAKPQRPRSRRLARTTERSARARLPRRMQ
jgi:hypothetical protein